MKMALPNKNFLTLGLKFFGGLLWIYLSFALSR